MLKLLSLFSGIGAFEKALDRIGVEYQLVNYCEIDKFASKSYSAIHSVSEQMNLWDVTKVDTDKLPTDIDLITYGFPCQDISLAGKQRGFHHNDGTLTRSGLFFEALRIIEETKPKIAIAENVKNLTGKKFKEQFKIVLDSLEEAGYNNYWKVLNAKDYGVPQNRERVFIVSIRKDIDTGLFEFPAPFPLEKRLKDILEDAVDDKYYLSEKVISGITKALTDGRGHKPPIFQNDNNHLCTIDTRVGAGTHRSPYIKEDKCEIDGIDKSNNNPRIIEVANCITSREDIGVSNRRNEGAAVIKQVAQMYPNSGNPQAGRVYDSDGISPAMDTCQGGNRMPKIAVREATKKGYAEAHYGDSINLEQPNSKTRRGRVGKGVAQTLTTSCNQDVVEPNVLTPKRTEYGKEIRKAYESGEILESRHNMTILMPRTDGVSNTLTTVQKDNYHLEPFIAASRGRNPENPSDRTVGSPTVQRLEPNSQGISNTLISVQKDNLVVEPSVRIRKLTAKECFRLMGFDDEDFEKAAQVNSNSQLYKQAGNSIVVDVLEELFCMMLDEDGEIFC